MCELCEHHKIILTREWKKTAGYEPERNSNCYKDWVNSKVFEQLEMFILKGKNDKKAGLMINTISGARYIDINYCPMCGRKLEAK